MNKSIIWKLYMLVFAVGILISSLHVVSLILILIINALILLFDKKNGKLMVLMSSFMMNEIFCLINVLLYFLLGFRKRTIKIKKPTSTQIILFIVVLSNSIICAIVYDTFVNILFASLYYILLLITWQICKDSASEYELIKVIKDFLHVQFILQILIGVSNRSFEAGDLFTGSLENAHFVALWALVQLFALYSLEHNVYKKSFLSNVRENLLSYIEGAVIIYLASAKAVLISAIFCLVVYVLIHNIIKSKQEVLVLIIGSYLIIAFGLVFLQIPIVKNLLMKNQAAYLYIYKPGWNVKYTYFFGTLFDSLKGYRSLIGYGIGQYGSRFANAFAYTEMYRNSNFINDFISATFKPHFVPQFSRYISIYSTEFVDKILWRSAILSYPFSSFIALIAEFGIIGVILFANFLQKTIGKSKCIVLVYLFFFACIFDIYFDNYQCIGNVIVILANTINVNVRSYKIKVVKEDYE